jgi:hypothetical protein
LSVECKQTYVGIANRWVARGTRALVVGAAVQPQGPCLRLQITVPKEGTDLHAGDVCEVTTEDFRLRWKTIP